MKSDSLWIGIFLFVLSLFFIIFFIPMEARWVGEDFIIPPALYPSILAAIIALLSLIIIVQTLVNRWKPVLETVQTDIKNPDENFEEKGLDFSNIKILSIITILIALPVSFLEKYTEISDQYPILEGWGYIIFAMVFLFIWMLFLGSRNKLALFAIPGITPIIIWAIFVYGLSSYLP